MEFEYPIHMIGDKKFEQLVALICQEILGTGTIIFADTKDGGRDGRFTGEAQKYPSSVKGWDGKIIIQAKHTIKIAGSCSDSDFNTQLKGEYPKLKKLLESGEIDYYLLFTNRQLTGMRSAQLKEEISKQVTLVDHEVIGKETINVWLNKYPQIPDLVGLNKYLLPLQFYEEELKELIVYFKAHLDSLSELVEKKEVDNTRIGLEEKNKKNKLSEEYFNSIIQQSLSYFNQIDQFLKDPKNKELLEAYKDTVQELNSKIISTRSQFNAFESIFDYLYEYILNKNSEELKKGRRLIYIFLHYMYYNCDIGVK